MSTQIENPSAADTAQLAPDTAQQIAREFSGAVIGLSNATEAKLAEIIRLHIAADQRTIRELTEALRALFAAESIRATTSANSQAAIAAARAALVNAEAQQSTSES